MKKNISIALIATIVLLAIAMVMLGTTGLNTKLTNGGCAVLIEVGSSYDSEAVKGYVDAAGFNNPVILETTKTAIEVETGAMSAENLDAAAEKLLGSILADHPAATLVYAESFAAPEGLHYFRGIVVALVALAVVGYIYGAVRYGWCKAFAPVCTSVIAAIVTGSVCALLSSVLTAGTVLTAVVAGAACLTYVYSVALYNKFMANAEYSVQKSDKAVPVLVIVASVLLTVSTGAISLMGGMLVATVVSAIAAHCLAPMFWQACSK